MHLPDDCNLCSDPTQYTHLGVCAAWSQLSSSLNCATCNQPQSHDCPTQLSRAANDEYNERTQQRQQQQHRLQQASSSNSSSNKQQQQQANSSSSKQEQQQQQRAAAARAARAARPGEAARAAGGLPEGPPLTTQEVTPRALR